MALIDSYVSGADLEKPVALTTDEIDRDEALAIAESTPASTAPEDEHTDDQQLTEERLKEAKRQAAEDKETRKGMGALQREQAKQQAKADKALREAAQKADHSKLPGPLGLASDAAHGQAKMWKNSAEDVGAILERASTPGSILLPVLILLVLFLAVMPVNGYPRLAWLWFVVTGNASLTGGTPAASMAPPPPPPVNTQASTEAREDQNTIAHRQLVQYHAYTGIEDVEWMGPSSFS
jgi:hypothetical protein